MVSKEFYYGLVACQRLWVRVLKRRSLVVLSHIISQLRPGADLNKVTLPTFILEPKSMLERITKYAFGPLVSDEF